jgi:Zn-dependent protease with chaperone function
MKEIVIALRGFVSVLIAVVIYIILYLSVSSLFENMPDNVWTFSLHLIFAEALAAFLAFLVGPFIMKRKYRMIIAGFMLYILCTMQIYELIVSTSEWMTFLVTIIRFSFSALGAILAILIVMNSMNKKTAVAQKAVTPVDSLKKPRKKPKTSIFLLLLSLFSVPTTYIVMILSAFITLGLSAWIIFVVLSIGHIPIIVLIAAAIAPFIGFAIAVKALWVMFVSKPAFQPGIKIDPEGHPYLRKMIYDTCDRVKARRPSQVVLHAEPTFFVMQGKVETFLGVVRGRILAIGVPIFKELNRLEFQSVLAHEFAHFSGRDTLYSSIVMPSYRAINSALEDIQNIGAGSSSNTMSLVRLLLIIPSLFLAAFARYFWTIDSAMSRSREHRADWIAANIYGHKSFSSALIKVAQISMHFAESTMDMRPDSDSNFFDNYSELLHSSSSVLEEYKNKAFTTPEDELDSHPPLATRIENLPIKDVEMLDYKNLMANARQELVSKERQLSRLFIERTRKMKEVYANTIRAIQERNQEEEVQEDKLHMVIICGRCYKKIKVKKGQGTITIKCPCCEAVHNIKT